MDIAKRKVAENDYKAAKTFAIKAQNLYPQLDGLKQVSMLIDVYISAGNKISGGESDWYGILGVDPSADAGVVKKQYKKLALLLHPDKNKCEGAEGAFKLVLEAWSLISDKVKRFAFDQKRNSNEVKPKRSRKQKQPAKKKQAPPNQQKPPPDQNQQPPPNEQKQPPDQQKPPPNQEKEAANQPKEAANQQKQPPNQPSSSGSRNGRGRSSKPTTKVSTFWTTCDKCETQHEFVRVFYLNKIVFCRNCRGSFKATEKGKTAQAAKENTHGASCGNVANQPEEKVVEESEETGRGIANSDFKVEERVRKKLRTDDCAAASCGIKV
ncbi:unnamed protein product [Thlaspi arvense]|uniref:J domain-containing protein n=1 Tax=Thlaspi arvense TaxID=13288 RepID=A0AAU9T908_THLAR|nr:unnamed protein product [Thlaspi arvense]